MKKLVMVFVFLMLIGGALAMDDAIRVKTEPGNEVRLAVRLLDGGSLGYNERGIADEDGYWEYTFFSLSREDVKYYVKVLSGLNLLREDVFESWGISDPLFVDCTSNPCVMSVDTRVIESSTAVVSEGVEGVGDVVNDSAVDVVENNSVIVEGVNVSVGDESSPVVVEEIIADESSEGVLSTGKAIFVKGDGSVNWVYSVGSGVVLLFVIIFIFMFVRHPKKGEDGEVDKKEEVAVADKNEEVAMDEDEKELEEEEKKVKEVAEKIKNLKDKKMKRTKIELARAKLAEEEAELRELEGEGNVTKIEEQKEVVGRAEDKVDSVKE